MPAYTVFDASIGYDLGKVGLKHVDVRLNTNSLTKQTFGVCCSSLNFCYLGEERSVSDGKLPILIRYRF